MNGASLITRLPASKLDRVSERYGARSLDPIEVDPSKYHEI